MRVGGWEARKFALFSPLLSQTSVLLFGGLSSRGFVAAVQGRGPPKVRNSVSLGSFSAILGGSKGRWVSHNDPTGVGKKSKILGGPAERPSAQARPAEGGLAEARSCGRAVLQRGGHAGTVLQRSGPAKKMKKRPLHQKMKKNMQK